MDHTTLSLPHTACNRTLQIADKSLHTITDEISIAFRLPEVSDNLYNLQFLVYDIPHDIILCSHAMHATSLGYHVFKPPDHPFTINSSALLDPLHLILEKLDFFYPEIHMGEEFVACQIFKYTSSIGQWISHLFRGIVDFTIVYAHTDLIFLIGRDDRRAEWNGTCYGYVLEKQISYTILERLFKLGR